MTLPLTLSQAGFTAPVGAAALGGRDRLVRRDPQDLAHACQELEAMFVLQLLRQLRHTLLAGVRKETTAQEQYLALADEAVAKTMAAGGGLGLAQRLYAHLSANRPTHAKGGSDGRTDNPPSSGGHHPGDCPLPAASGLYGG